ncbi:hypothetical protein HYH03_007596 [Edaphochlamys debaryana]|uniref:Group 1 truncated hemoglobin n=2 Tax=Edaphochlamys debaryana TaxID=47281 RepID=A0A835Y4Y8_9CHLO|nr:hypothetical protein HYH03_007594 [Edaphochlamys debaryana]KAG2494241.1 hypothetical protein HYH03_007596 [Edaphochlamys debaryana]|eukprot:KAG2494239.1 hypothetical protein HYH03_007594 [Edaphochlamys debaryana]
MDTAQSLYNRLGGAEAVQAAVGIFYARLLKDAALMPFFEGVDMKAQERKQVAFMTYVFGGAGAYQGRDLAAAHRRLILEKGLEEEHFDLVAGHLLTTLSELQVPTPLIEEAMGIVATTKPVIFGRV